MARKSCPSWQQHRGRGRRGFDSPQGAIGVTAVTPDGRTKAGAADEGRCPCELLYRACSKEIVATIWGGDTTTSGKYYNVCSNHVDKYREGKWKTLEMYPLVIAEAEVKPARPDPTKIPDTDWTDKHFNMLCTCGERFGGHRGASPFEYVHGDNGCKGFVDSGRDYVAKEEVKK